MPRYYFHVSHKENERDQEGVELPDFPAAWAEAVRACGEMLVEIAGDLQADVPFEMTIGDEKGEVLCHLRFTAEFTGRPR